MRTDDDEEPSVKRIQGLSEELNFDITNQGSNSREGIVYRRKKDRCRFR